MSVKLLTEHHLEFLSLKRGYTGSSTSTLVKIPHCWKSHVTAQFFLSHLYNIVRMVNYLCFLTLFGQNGIKNILSGYLLPGKN